MLRHRKGPHFWGPDLLSNCGAAGNRTRPRNRVDLQRYRQSLRETTCRDLRVRRRVLTTSTDRQVASHDHCTFTAPGDSRLTTRGRQPLAERFGTLATASRPAPLCYPGSRGLPKIGHGYPQRVRSIPFRGDICIQSQGGVARSEVPRTRMLRSSIGDEGARAVGRVVPAGSVLGADR
jgi:hypothetical protein